MVDSLLVFVSHTEMQSALRFHFQASNPGIVVPHTNHAFATNVNSHRTLSCTKHRSLPQSLCSLTAQPSNHTSTTVGSPSLPHWNLTNRHVTVLNVFACAAFKKAAESMEKLMDATREELPNTMAVIPVIRHGNQ
ncbi:hypothetical protein JHK87_010869 [Glycine soja]|nr:hypothetical protein JHK87_010869 [Glycine soja]